MTSSTKPSLWLCPHYMDESYRRVLRSKNTCFQYKHPVCMRRHSIIRCLKKKKKRYPVNITVFHYQPGYLIIERFKEEAKRDVFIAAAAKSCQSCLTLCDPTDGSPPGSPVPGILQARILEWGPIAFSNVFINFSTSNPPLPNPHCTPSSPHL